MVTAWVRLGCFTLVAYQPYNKLLLLYNLSCQYKLILLVYVHCSYQNSFGKLPKIFSRQMELGSKMIIIIWTYARWNFFNISIIIILRSIWSIWFRWTFMPLQLSFIESKANINHIYIHLDSSFFRIIRVHN